MLRRLALAVILTAYHPAQAQTWQTVSDENQTFTLPAGYEVRYGAEPSWLVKIFPAGPVLCANQSFPSDPIVGTRKSCQIRLAVSPLQVPSQIACLPSPFQNKPPCLIATEPVIGFSPLGVWLAWRYTTSTDPKPRTILFIGTWTEVAKASTRIDTIRKSADPLTSLQTAGKRFKISPLTDPALAPLLALAQADIATLGK